jgi:uncharacterized protein (TIGR03382 family)
MGTLTPGQSTGEIQARFNKDDWSNFAEADDYSFDPTKTSFADWDRVTVYQAGALIWGTEPPLAFSLVGEPRAADEPDGPSEPAPGEASAPSGGCSAGATGSPIGLALAAAAMLLGRRRRRTAR